MPTYKFYVRGHGGDEEQMLPPSEHVAIDLITVGQYGCTMEGSVADRYLYNHYGIEQIQSDIDDEILIYWTHAQREEWHDERRLEYTNPAMTIHPYDTLNLNLALDGHDEIGECGVCYWNESRATHEWIIRLEHGQTILLSDILSKLRAMLGEDDIIQLFWTACLSADYWHGSKKALSFNPTK